jgi:hypothetical protein
MRSLWETMLSQWLGRAAAPSVAAGPIAVAVWREPAIRAGATPTSGTLSPRDLAPASEDTDAERAIG